MFGTLVPIVAPADNGIATTCRVAVGAGYRIFDKSTNKEVFFSGAVSVADYVQEGNPVVPFGLKVQLKDLPAGNYHVVLLAVDALHNQAPPREADFVLSD